MHLQTSHPLRQPCQNIVLPVVSFLATIFLGVHGRCQDLADVIEKAEKSVIRIETMGSDGGGLGSGFVVDEQGTFVTNCHVLAGATQAVAFFPDGQRVEILGTLIIDQSRDIVVGKISTNRSPIQVATNLPRKGERVTALGSPQGLSFTATTGIISAIRGNEEMARDVGQPDIQGTWIQVDAALSPGNSGGPLINSQGQVVAMSTLASTGRAQNLNFGISCQDINTAIRVARSARIKTLRAGVANIKMSDERSGPGDPKGPPPVPQSALANYIQSGKEEFSYLIRSLKIESSRLSTDLKQMRTGATYFPSSLARDPKYSNALIVKVNVAGARYPKWFFRSSSAKDRAIDKQQSRIREHNKLKSLVRDKENPQHLNALLWNFGPGSDRVSKGSISFFKDIIVLKAVTGNEVLAIVEGTPYILWFDSTAGIAAGDIMSGPGYVVGAETIELQSAGSTAITLVRMVTQKELESAVQSDLGTPANSSPTQTISSDGYRTWHDRSGKFSVEALLIDSDAAQVVIKRRDGKILTIPKSKLSMADQKYIDQ